jgi:tRNA-Thr(GGU) m(6)t(6)A37 methyltransferase TsaA
MEKIKMTPIGLLHTPHKTPKGAPIQPSGARGIAGKAQLFAPYKEGLKDLEGFSHVILLYFCHLVKPFNLLVTPFLDNTPRGLFATRAPSRPNSIGISLVRLVKVEDDTLFLLDVDMVDGSPLLDIKPFVGDFDMPLKDDPVRTGWLEKRAEGAAQKKGDDRF